MDPTFVENFETESPSGVVDDNVDDDVVDDDCWFDSFVCFQNQVVLFLVLFLAIISNFDNKLFYRKLRPVFCS